MRSYTGLQNYMIGASLATRASWAQAGGSPVGWAGLGWLGDGCQLQKCRISLAAILTGRRSFVFCELYAVSCRLRSVRLVFGEISGSLSDECCQVERRSLRWAVATVNPARWVLLDQCKSSDVMCGVLNLLTRQKAFALVASFALTVTATQERSVALALDDNCRRCQSLPWPSFNGHSVQNIQYNYTTPDLGRFCRTYSEGLDDGGPRSGGRR